MTDKTRRLRYAQSFCTEGHRHASDALLAVVAEIRSRAEPAIIALTLTCEDDGTWYCNFTIEGTD